MLPQKKKAVLQDFNIKKDHGLKEKENYEIIVLYSISLFFSPLPYN